MSDTDSSVRQIWLHGNFGLFWRHNNTLGKNYFGEVTLSKSMQWLNFKPKGEALREIHKGRGKACLAMQNSCGKKKTSDLVKTQWTVGFTRPHFLKF